MHRLGEVLAKELNRRFYLRRATIGKKLEFIVEVVHTLSARRRGGLNSLVRDGARFHRCSHTD